MDLIQAPYIYLAYRRRQKLIYRWGFSNSRLLWVADGGDDEDDDGDDDDGDDDDDDGDDGDGDGEAPPPPTWWRAKQPNAEAAGRSPAAPRHQRFNMRCNMLQYAMAKM